MATARGPSPAEEEREELRIVLLGRVEAGRTKVARFLLGNNQPEGEIGSCIIHDGEAEGRRIYLVDTPGWDRHAIQKTPEKIKREIIKSPTLCPPGPHALIVVLRVESLTDVPSTKQLKTVSQHMELLSERVWNHTMLLFLCDEEVEDHNISEHIQKANRLLEKCGNRHFVLRSETQVPEFLQEIEKMVEGNCGDFFLPQIYYDYIRTKTPGNIIEMTKMYEDREDQLKRGFQKRIGVYNKQAAEDALRRRRGSFEGRRPGMKDNDQTVDTIATKIRYWIEMLEQHHLKPAVALILICALFVLMGGPVYGLMGLCLGIVIGAIAMFPLIGSASLEEKSSNTLQDRKLIHME